MDFIKMHGLGNDFVFVDCRSGGDIPPRSEIARLSQRHTGIGCDQFLVLLAPPPPPPPPQSGQGGQSDCFMKIFNADGSEAQACGNATRCAADIVMRESGQERCVIQTVAGFLICTRVADGLICVDMGAPRLEWKQIPLAESRDTLSVDIQVAGLPAAVAVNIGNPHCVFFIDEPVEGYPVHEIGAQIETHALFPEKTNVEFINVLDRKTLRMRVWERGVGETNACGSGACAAYVAAVRRGLVEREGRVILNGGALDFHWREEDGHILMTGPAVTVFKGNVV
ncbi:MAG: diaminopimelate epimerase [Alphaproteobacteria bacterium]